MSRPNLDKGGRIVFIAAERAAVEAAGIAIVQTGGSLHHQFADPRHRDLHVPDHQTIAAAAACFLGGELFAFEGKEVASAARNAMKANLFAWHPIATLGFEGNMRAKNLLKFIVEEIATVHGVAA